MTLAFTSVPSIKFVFGGNSGNLVKFELQLSVEQQQKKCLAGIGFVLTHSLFSQMFSLSVDSQQPKKIDKISNKVTRYNLQSGNF